jgi:hypothetical protein
MIQTIDEANARYRSFRVLNSVTSTLFSGCVDQEHWFQGHPDLSSCPTLGRKSSPEWHFT